MRLNVVLSEKDGRLFKSLMELAGTGSKTQVILYAIVFLSWALKAVFEGKKIVALDEKNDRYQELQMLPIQHAQMLGEAERDKRRVPEAAE